MKVTDYIIEFLISKNVTDIFGYPGGVICHFIDSATKYQQKIKVHTNYHEQASAFAACGYAQEKCNIGVAFTTSGPGATNLATGIANAFYDSTPTMFFTGQVDTYGLKGKMRVRQRGFQETDVVNIYKAITKYAVRIDDPNLIVYELEKAYMMAIDENPGPVLIDIPADVQRAEINVSKCKKYVLPAKKEIDYCECAKTIIDTIKNAKQPCIIAGNGIKQSNQKEKFKSFIHKIGIPTVFSMPAVDILSFEDVYNLGFIGANGHRYANFVLAKSDLIIAIGTRMDLKQVGNARTDFCKQSKIIRIDIDDGNFENIIHDETYIIADIKKLIPCLDSIASNYTINDEWIKICKEIKLKLYGYDDENYTILLKEFCKALPDEISITADVGQSEVWLAQQIQIKEKQTLHISAGHGAMGYSLPAAIGAYYAGKKPVCSFNGDGGIQMNIQELQFLARERIPVWVVIINNNSLGMIRGFQEANFNKNYSQTITGKGYSAPDFEKIAKAYNLNYQLISSGDDIKHINRLAFEPTIIEIKIQDETVLNPNFGKNGLIQDQRPYIDRKIFNELMNM